MRPGIRSPGRIFKPNKMELTKMISPLLLAGAVMPASAQRPAEAPAASQPAARPPHLILIVTDQQRGDALGCCNSAVISPNLDALAREGVRFESAYSSAPSSTPARAGLLTGMSPWGHGMLGYGNVAEHYPYEMPQMLREAGYWTLGIGKMHWAPQNATHGFHATLIDESGRVESPYFMSDYRKWFACHAPGLDPDATGIGWNAHGAAAYALPEELHPTVWTGDRAVEAIEGYRSDKPFFLTVSFARPHSPYDAPQRLVDAYEGVEVPAPAIGDWCAEFGRMTDPARDPDAPYGDFGADYAINSKRHYYASVTFIDEQIGRIVRALRERDMYDDALICFVSDHGDMMGDHHHWRKTYAYEGSAHIPFLVKFPAGAADCPAAGTTDERVVELRDVLPTFLHAAGAEIPESMEGQSLLGDGPWREWLDLEHATCYSDDNYWCALTDGRWKYIWFLHTGRERLFDLEADPSELHDLAGDAASSSELALWRSRMADHLRIRGEEWVRDGQLVVRERTLLYGPAYPRPTSVE